MKRDITTLDNWGFNINKIVEHKIGTRYQFEIKLTALLQGTVHPGITYFSIQR